LVRNPQILFLDEATSWLDANSQARVMQGIESLAATRIVIAHRLSTIRKAGRIYVIQDGQVVQQGNFDELYEAEGTFRELVRRQMA
ncbi:MAG: NHLP bacteriocin export ABC transporter permease/ATPase subunit, partial [Candidatus Tectomicrobia bacterium]|nr:NHLP bacteriocin export ABC transporter permease/ATPase subunit [Candidatus Tectomicrobia bacterium]